MVGGWGNRRSVAGAPGRGGRENSGMGGRFEPDSAQPGRIAVGQEAVGNRRRWRAAIYTVRRAARTCDGATGRRGDGGTKRTGERANEQASPRRPVAPSPRHIHSTYRRP